MTKKMANSLSYRVEKLFRAFYFTIEENDGAAYYEIVDFARLNVDFTLQDPDDPEVRLVMCARRILISIRRVRNIESGARI
jgi:hypothetical protein